MATLTTKTLKISFFSATYYHTSIQVIYSSSNKQIKHKFTRVESQFVNILFTTNKFN